MTRSLNEDDVDLCVSQSRFKGLSHRRSIKYNNKLKSSGQVVGTPSTNFLRLTLEDVYLSTD